jgi:hypothetical protein
MKDFRDCGGLIQVMCRLPLQSNSLAAAGAEQSGRNDPTTTPVAAGVLNVYCLVYRADFPKGA